MEARRDDALQCYRWMSDKFGLKSHQAHIGNFSECMCDELMAECRKALRNNKIAC